MVRKILLACGIASSLLYVAATILGAMQWQSYRWTSQSVSELFALDAPSRSLVAIAFLAYGVLVIAFGWGVWLSAGSNRALRIGAGLLIGYGIVGVPGPLFFSMHTMVRGAPGGAQRDILHIILTAVLVLLILLSIGFGAAAFGMRFRLYSIGTLMMVVVFGALAGVQGGRMAANQPTPWMGIEERINIFGFLIWIAVLAVALLRARAERPEASISAPGARRGAIGCAATARHVVIRTRGAVGRGGHRFFVLRNGRS